MQIFDQTLLGDEQCVIAHAERMGNPDALVWVAARQVGETIIPIRPEACPLAAAARDLGEEPVCLGETTCCEDFATFVGGAVRCTARVGISKA